MHPEELPEGTDTIIEGAGVGADDAFDADVRDEETDAAPDADAKADAPQEPVSFSARIDALKGQAGDQARDFATSARDRATGSIDDIARMIEDAANEIDDKVGSQYGDYVRRAADSVSGLSESLKNKDIDTVFADARELIRKSPGIAIGVTATVGFVLARLVRAGIPDTAHDAAKAA